MPAIDNNIPSHQVLIDFNDNHVRSISYSTFLNTEVVDHFDLKHDGVQHSLTGTTPSNEVEDFINAMIKLTDSTVVEVCSMISNHIKTMYGVSDENVLQLVHGKDDVTFITFVWDECTDDDDDENEEVDETDDNVCNFIKQLDHSCFIRVVHQRQFCVVFFIERSDDNEIDYRLIYMYNRDENEKSLDSIDTLAKTTTPANVATIKKLVATLVNNQFDINYLNTNYIELTSEKYHELFGRDPIVVD